MTPNGVVTITMARAKSLAAALYAFCCSSRFCRKSSASWRCSAVAFGGATLATTVTTLTSGANYLLTAHNITLTTCGKLGDRRTLPLARQLRPSNSIAKVAWEEMSVMAYTLEQQIAECYRRAEESRRLYYRSSNLNERESYFITTMHLT